MRFKATVRDPKMVAGICSTQHAFAKKSIVKLHPTKMRFITTTGITDGCQVWTSCRTEVVLSDLIIESKLDNAIYVEVLDMAQLHQALKCCDKATNVTLKLLRIDTKQLLKLSMQALQDQHDVHHDIAVRVLKEQEVQAIFAPPMDDSMLEVVLPSLSDMLVFVDRLKGTSCSSISIEVERHHTPTVGVAAPAANGDTNGTARLALTSENLHAKFVLSYQSVDLVVRRGAEGDDAARDDCGMLPPKSRVTVDLRKFARFLSVKGIFPKRMVMHVVHERALVISCYAASETNLVFYVPALLQS